MRRLDGQRDREEGDFTEFMFIFSLHGRPIRIFSKEWPILSKDPFKDHFYSQISSR